MKIYTKGEYRDATPEELKAAQARRLRHTLRRQSEPMTESEVMRLVIGAQINTLAVDDNTALRMKQYYPTFDEIAGRTVKQGFKFRYGGELWKVAQPELTVQSHYAPGTGAESLYTRVDETHAGTQDDPIPYKENMELTEGLHYHQDYVLYRCTRSTGQPVHNALGELVGLYVETV